MPGVSTARVGRPSQAFGAQADKERRNAASLRGQQHRRGLRRTRRGRNAVARGRDIAGERGPVRIATRQKESPAVIFRHMQICVHVVLKPAKQFRPDQRAHLIGCRDRVRRHKRHNLIQDVGIGWGRRDVGFGDAVGCCAGHNAEGFSTNTGTLQNGAVHFDTHGRVHVAPNGLLKCSSALLHRLAANPHVDAHTKFRLERSVGRLKRSRSGHVGILAIGKARSYTGRDHRPFACAEPDIDHLRPDPRGYAFREKPVNDRACRHGVRHTSRYRVAHL